MNPFDEYCQKTAPQGSLLYYSLLLTPEKLRLAIIALHALKKELDLITEHYREIDIARNKLQWWQQELNALYTHKKAQHPISQILLTAIDEYTLPQPLFTEWLDGALIKLDSNHLCTEQDLLAFCYRQYGICVILSAYVLGFKKHSSLPAVNAFAVAAECIRLIENYPFHIKRGWCFMPLDWLSQHAITEELLQAGTIKTEIQALLQHVFDMAKYHYQSGIEKIPNEDKKALKPLLAYAGLQIKTGQIIAASDFPLFHEKNSLTPIRAFFSALKMLY